MIALYYKIAALQISPQNELPSSTFNIHFLSDYIKDAFKCVWCSGKTGWMSLRLNSGQKTTNWEFAAKHKHNQVTVLCNQILPVCDALVAVQS